MRRLCECVVTASGEYDSALFALGKIGAECRVRRGELYRLVNDSSTVALFDFHAGETYSLLKQKCEVSQLILLLMLQVGVARPHPPTHTITHCDYFAVS